MSPRQEETLRPTPIRRGAPGPIPSDLGEIYQPDRSDEPILDPITRRAVLGWLREIESRAELAAAGLKPRSSVLLEGPPGCGKTTLAGHVAGRLGVPMLVVGAERLTSPYTGKAEEAVTRLFDTIDQLGERVLLFLDEFDAVGSKRSNRDDSATRSDNSRMTVLLRRIERTPATVMAATNRADALDPALWRRFAMQITIGLPGEEERWAICKRYSMPYEFAADLLDEIAVLTEGASPALLRQLMEGLKRNLVLGPRLGAVAADAAEAVAAVTAAVRPHPDYEPPPLWSMSLTPTTAALWPPARAEG